MTTANLTPIPTVEALILLARRAQVPYEGLPFAVTLRDIDSARTVEIEPHTGRASADRIVSEANDADSPALDDGGAIEELYEERDRVIAFRYGELASALSFLATHDADGAALRMDRLCAALRYSGDQVGRDWIERDNPLLDFLDALECKIGREIYCDGDREFEQGSYRALALKYAGAQVQA